MLKLIRNFLLMVVISFCGKVLAVENEQKIKQEITSKNKHNLLVKDLSVVAGYATAISLIIALPETSCLSLKKLSSAWKLIFKSIGIVLMTDIVGSILSNIYKPVAVFLIDLFYKSPDIHEIDSKKFGIWLNKFLKNWPQNKPQVPALLHETFDMLYARYCNNGLNLVLSVDETQEIIEIMISCLLLDTAQPKGT